MTRFGDMRVADAVFWLRRMMWTCLALGLIALCTGSAALWFATADLRIPDLPHDQWQHDRSSGLRCSAT